MNLETYRNYCLAKAGTTESFPFNEEVLVFKVGGKMFALSNIVPFEKVSLKCEPERAVQLREEYPSIEGAYHMNKTHWNSIEVNCEVSDKLIFELIDHSYELIFNSLTKAKQKEIEVKERKFIP